MLNNTIAKGILNRLKESPPGKRHKKAPTAVILTPWAAPPQATGSKKIWIEILRFVGKCLQNAAG